MSSRPHKPRIAVNERATLHVAGGEAVQCSFLDVSQDGFRLRTDRALPSGTGYTLSFGGETHPVEIRWSTGTEAGGLFSA